MTASGPLNATARARANLAKLSRDPSMTPVEALAEALTATDPVLVRRVYFGAALDMRSLTRHPLWPDANPQSNAVPMLLGDPRGEARAFVPAETANAQGAKWDNLAAVLTPKLRVDIYPEWVVAR